MARNSTIVSLFDKYGYVVRRTDPNTSHKYYPDEVHQIYIG